MRRVQLKAPNLSQELAGVTNGKVWADLHVVDGQLVSTYYDSDKEERVTVPLSLKPAPTPISEGEEFIMDEQNELGTSLVGQLLNYGVLVLSRTKDGYNVYGARNIKLLEPLQLDEDLATLVDIARERGLIEWDLEISAQTGFVDAMYLILTDTVPQLRKEKEDADMSAEQNRTLWEETRLELDQCQQSLRGSQDFNTELLQRQLELEADNRRLGAACDELEKELKRVRSDREWTENNLRERNADLSRDLHDQENVLAGYKQALTTVVYTIANRESL